MGYYFFDFDFEVEKHFNSYISALKRECMAEHDYRKKARVVLSKILEDNKDNFVLAMPPSGLMDFYWRIIKEDESLVTIALKDRAKNIFKRLTFYDEYSKPEKVVIRKEQEKGYLKGISLDIEYFGRTYSRAKVNYNICGKSALQAADDLHEMLSGISLGEGASLR